MAKIIDLPKLSPTMEEGTLVRWAKNEGDAVAIDDLLAEVETDKATMEFRAFDKGTLLKQLVAAGQTAKLGQPVAIFGAVGEDISAVLQEARGKMSGAPAPSEVVAATAPLSAAPVVSPATEAPSAVVATRPKNVAASPTMQAQRAVAGLMLMPSADGPVQAVVNGAPGGPSSPRVRKLARDAGLDVSKIVGSGTYGRITETDIERAAQRGAAPARVNAPANSQQEPRASESRPASQMRKVIARRLTESKQTVPHFYLEADLAVEALTALREELNEGVEKEQKISVNDLFIRACALALREVPASNASWMDGTIVTHGRVDVSVAVAIEDGLVTPVVRSADRKSISEIASEVRALATRARAKKLTPEEMTGGTFSISNLGMYGVDRFSAVINPPEGMILAVGAVREVPVVKSGAVVPGKRCAVTVSCDHRVVDGALGAQFLAALRAIVERPIRILR